MHEWSMILAGLFQNHYNTRDGRHIPGQKIPAQQPVKKNHYRKQTGFELEIEYDSWRATGNWTDFWTSSDIAGKHVRSSFTPLSRQLYIFFFFIARRFGLWHHQSSIAIGENIFGADYSVLESIVAESEHIVDLIF